MYEKSTANIILTGEQREATPLNKRITDCYLSFQYSSGSTETVRQEKEIKGIQTGQ